MNNNNNKKNTENKKRAVKLQAADVVQTIVTNLCDLTIYGVQICMKLLACQLQHNRGMSRYISYHLIYNWVDKNRHKCHECFSALSIRTNKKLMKEKRKLKIRIRF